MQHELEALVDRDGSPQPLGRRVADVGKRRLAEGAKQRGHAVDVDGLRGPGADQQAGQHPGDRGVQARVDGRHPEHEEHDGVHAVAPLPAPREQRDAGQRRARDGERHEVERPGVDDADDRDGDHVVEHGDRQQEDAQLRRASGSDDRQGAEHERRVGRDDDAPAIGRLAGGSDRQVQRRREGHARQRAEDRRDDAPALGQLAHRQLPAHLEPDHQEEQRHEAVADPVPEVHRKLSAADPHGRLRMPQRLVGLRPLRVGPQQRDEHRRQHHPGAARLGGQEPAQRLGDLGDEHAPRRPRLAAFGGAGGHRLGAHARAFSRTRRSHICARRGDVFISRRCSSACGILRRAAGTVRGQDATTG